MFRKSLSDRVDMALLEHRHAPEMINLIQANKDYLRHWLPWVDTTTSLRDSRQWIKEALKLYAEGRELHAGIWYEGNLAGVIGCMFSWRHHSAVIGYWLGAQYQGKGTMTMSCQAMLHHTFTSLNINRVEIRCAAENQRSRAIPQRLGFKQEGIIRDAEWLYDHYVDHVIYGLLAREWAEGICPDADRR